MDVRVVSLVEDSIYVAALPNEPGQAELGEVLGDRLRLSPRCHGQVALRFLAMDQDPYVATSRSGTP